MFDLDFGYFGLDGGRHATLGGRNRRDVAQRVAGIPDGGAIWRDRCAQAVAQRPGVRRGRGFRSDRLAFGDHVATAVDILDMARASPAEKPRAQ